jgi:hypothetical protein
MSNRKHLLAAAVVTACAISGSAFAGGALDTVDITAGTVTVPGFVDGDVIPIRWDARCMPVAYTLDTTPPNFNTAAPDIDLATTRAELQASFDQWNGIRTSWIEMNITRTENIHNGVLDAPGAIGAFDFINEINFVTRGGFLAASPSVSLIRDATLVPGQDIDLDGDSDVYAPSGHHTTCRDADGDGDIEFPAGDYEAGTILDNDIGFSATVGIPWNTTPDNLLTTDIQAVAVHEFGHSHGLSHSFINQFSRTDGEGATMFPFIDINDPGTESSQRTPAPDDIAWSSYTYPENTASSGPAALQGNDQGFDSHFGLVKGTVTSGRTGAPVAGANIWVQTHGGRVMVSGYSGTTRLLVQPGASGITDADAGLFFGPNAAFSVLNGDYTIPVQAGDYFVGLQSLDGQPAAPGNISLNAIVGGRFSDLDFREEFWNRENETGTEELPGQQFTLRVNNGGVTDHVDFVTHATNTLRRHDGNFDANDPFGFTAAPGGRLYAVRFPNADASAFMAGTTLLTMAQFLTDVADASVPVNFASARLTTGSLNPDGTASVNLLTPLARSTPFAAQDTDFSPWFFNNPQGLSNTVRNRLSQGLDLFLVLEVPDAPFPGVSNAAPLIGLDNDTVGSSFVSDDGGVTFNPQAGFNYFFDLVARP